MRKAIDRRPSTRQTTGLCASVGEKLRRLRISSGLSQVLAAERAGVGVRHLVRIEQGANISLRTLEALVATYGRSVRVVVTKAAARRPDRAGRPSTRQ